MTAPKSKLLLDDFVTHEKIIISRKCFQPTNPNHKVRSFYLIYTVDKANKKYVISLKISKEKLAANYLDLKHWIETVEEKSINKVIEKYKSGVHF